MDIIHEKVSLAGCDEVSEPYETAKIKSLGNSSDDHRQAYFDRAIRLIFFAAGLILFYLWFGILLEQITRTKYGQTGDKFAYTITLVFVQCVSNVVLACILRGSFRDDVPARTYSCLALSYLLAMTASNRALIYISYPTQVLGKSCKPIPIMIFGMLFAGKRYHWKKYFLVLMIIVGIILFMYKDQEVKESAHSSWSLGFGELLLFFSLTMDGTLGAFQDNIRRSYNFTGNSMMFSMNLHSSIYLLFMLVVSGELLEFISFVKLYPFVLKNLLLLAISSSLGQFFIFQTISEFGPLTCSIITTARKMFTMALSVIIFGNVLTLRQVIGAIIVFTGLFLDALESKRKNEHAAKAKF